MANFENLPAIFAALADPTRLAIVRRLSGGDATVKELAAYHAMALPSFLRHIRVLEAAGLIESTKQGRVRTCRLTPTNLENAEVWLGYRRRLVESREN